MASGGYDDTRRNNSHDHHDGGHIHNQQQRIFALQSELHDVQFWFGQCIAGFLNVTMPAWSQFCGGSYQSRSPTLDCEQTINLYPATVESQTNTKQKSLIGTPGLRRLMSVATTGCRGIFSEDGRTWCVTGGVLYELDLAANTATSRGTIANDGLPVSFASNGRGGEQLAICGGGAVYVLDLETNVLTGPIALPLTNAAVQIEMIDGYGLLLEADTVKVWFSALENFESWDALDYWARSQTSDNYVALAVVRDRIYAMGSSTTD